MYAPGEHGLLPSSEEANPRPFGRVLVDCCEEQIQVFFGSLTLATCYRDYEFIFSYVYFQQSDVPIFLVFYAAGPQYQQPTFSLVFVCKKVENLTQHLPSERVFMPIT